MNLTTLFDTIAGKQKQREQVRANDFPGRGIPRRLGIMPRAAMG